MEKLTGYEQALVLTTIETLPLEQALSSISKQLSKDKCKKVKAFLIEFITKKI